MTDFMRCLHCNKKLSLLKLAKGDSFCSPEHFDAHQLQLSKNAIERLMALPDEDAPKAPLVFKHVEEEAEPTYEPPEESAALARLTGFKPPEAVEGPAIIAPPYAPFATSRLPSYSLNPPSAIANGPEAGEPVEAVREVSFPVHDVEVTVCILNLYLRLSLAGTGPKDWTPERHLIVTIEDFRLDVTLPSLAMGPEFPEIKNLAEVEPEPATDAAPAVEDAPLLLEPASLVEDATFIEAVPSVEPVPSIEAAPSAEAAAVVDGLPPAEPSSLEKPIQIFESRVPFLMAPSFGERNGAPIILDGAASSAPHGSTLAPILDRGCLPRLDSCAEIPKSIRFVKNTALQVRDSMARWIKTGSEVPIKPDFIFPDAKEQSCEDAWRASERRMAIVRAARDTTQARIRSLDYGLPEPASLVVLPDSSCVPNVDPQQLLAGTSLTVDASAFRVFETPPLGTEPIFAHPPPCALEFGWRTALAPFPSRKPVPFAWQHRTTYFSLPDTITAGSESGMPPVEQLPYAPDCLKMACVEKAELPAPYVAKGRYLPTAWPQSDFSSLPFLAEPGLVFSGSTMLPRVAEVPAGSLKMSADAPSLSWQPRAGAKQNAPAAKFLPTRIGAKLPSANNWPHLGLMPPNSHRAMKTLDSDADH